MFELIREDNYREEMETRIEPALAALRRIEQLPLRDGCGGSLHMEYYWPEHCRGAVVMLHGFTESAEKLREMAWYFLSDGLAVFSYDHRGHGSSYRAVSDPWLVHTEHFNDYVEDLEQIMTQVILPRTGALPLYLYAHSMGGAVGALYLSKHPDVFGRAVLTSPMICPVTAPLPFAAGRAVGGLLSLIGLRRRMAFVGKPYDAQTDTFENSCDTGRERFAYYAAKRAAQTRLQTSAPTYGWAYESTGVPVQLLKRRRAEKIRTPLLLCQAGLDNIVSLPAQDRFVAMVQSAEKVGFPAARHEIYMSDDDTMAQYVPAVLKFLRG